MKTYLESVKKQFNYYKSLGEKTLVQLNEEQLSRSLSLDGNSIAQLVKHLNGNMRSRWTNFLEEDGEKSWRNRDEEFSDPPQSRETVMKLWKNGWSCLFKALNSIDENDLIKIIYIRNMGHTVIEAINRQMMHYAYHIGQMVIIGKSISDSEWKSLSIPKGGSKNYNVEKFNKKKSQRHFTDDL